MSPAPASPTALDAAALETLLSAAVAAPSLHHTQPWRFRLAPASRTVEIHAAAERSLPYEDPHGRALHLAAGAALFNLRLAVAHLGWCAVTRLLPDPRHPGLLATVRVTGGGKHPVHRRDLYDAVWRRHSSRFPFSERPVPTAVLRELTEVAHTEGARLVLLSPRQAAHLLDVTAEAERRNRSDPDRAGESRRRASGRTSSGTSGTSPAPRVGTGMSAPALGVQDASGTVPMRDVLAERRPERLPSRAFERHPTVALLTTDHDRRIDWLRAGQALEHTLLVATASGLRTSLLHQAVEWPDLRVRLRTRQAPRTHPQMLVRLGYGPEGPATPRLPVRELLHDGALSAAGPA